MPKITARSDNNIPIDAIARDENLSVNHNIITAGLLKLYQAMSKFSLINENDALPRKEPNTGTWELNIADKRLAWSDSQYRLYGYEPGEVKLDNDFFILNTTHPSDVKRISAIIDHAMKNDEGYDFKRRIVRKDGSFGFVRTRARIIRSRRSEPLKIIGSTTDVQGITENGFLDCNDPAYFDKLYKSYKKSVTSEIYKWTLDRDLSDDLAQEVFFKAWHHMSKYDSSKGAVYSWLITIARNHCKDHFGSRHFQNQQLTGSVSEMHDSMHDRGGEAHVCTRELLLKLPAEQREAMELVFIQGFTQEEVARNQRIPLGTVKTRCRAAVKKMRAFIGEE